MTTKQSQIKTNKTIQTLKILPFSMLSASLCLSFSLILSTPLFTSHLLKQLRQGSKPGQPPSTTQALGFSASPPFRPSLILSLNLLSASLNSQLLSAHQPFTSGINIWGLGTLTSLVIRLRIWDRALVLGLQVFFSFLFIIIFFIFIKPSFVKILRFSCFCNKIKPFFFWVIDRICFVFFFMCGSYKLISLVL